MRYFALMIASVLVGFVIGQNMYAVGQVRLFELIP